MISIGKRLMSCPSTVFPSNFPFLVFGIATCCYPNIKHIFHNSEGAYISQQKLIKMTGDIAPRVPTQFYLLIFDKAWRPTRHLGNILQARHIDGGGWGGLGVRVEGFLDFNRLWKNIGHTDTLLKIYPTSIGFAVDSMCKQCLKKCHVWYLYVGPVGMFEYLWNFKKSRMILHNSKFASWFSIGWLHLVKEWVFRWGKEHLPTTYRPWSVGALSNNMYQYW